MKHVAIGDRVTITKSLPAVQWVDANDLERAVIGGVHRSPGAEGTVEYLTRGPEGLFSVEVRHDDGNLAPYLANELDAMSTPVDTSDWLSWAVGVWNQRVPVGAPVALTEDNGSITETVTRSEAWHLGDGTPVVKVDGRTGGYLLRRILPIGPRQVTEGDAGLVQRMRDCLLELAGEPAESETIAELIQRVRETVRRPAQIVMKLLADLEAHDFVDIASQLRKNTIPQLYVADALKALAACEQPASSGEPLCYADPARFAETDIAQIVGRLVALEAAVFDNPSEADKRGWDYIASEEHKAVEEASVILAKLAPGLGSASLKEQAEEIRRRFALLAQEWQAVAAMTSEWREDSILGPSARAVWYAHHRARKAVSGIFVGDVL